MKRFNNNNEDEEYDEKFFSDDDDDDDDEDEEYDDDDDDDDEDEYLERRQALDFIQLDLIELDINQRLLFKTIRMLEKSWFWNFRTYKSKMRKIIETYKFFQVLLEDPKEEEVEDA